MKIMMILINIIIQGGVSVWTKKAGLLFFFATLSLFMGLILTDFQFMVLALLIYTFFLLVLVLPHPSVDVERNVNNSVLFENSEVDVNIKITKKRSGFGTIELYDKIPAYSLLKYGVNTLIFNPPSSITLDYNLKFPLRGYYSVGPTQVRLADHFSIFYKDQIIQEKEPISIYPHVSGLKEFKFKSRKNIHYPGEFLTSQAGASNEFYHIRDYIKGDAFKRINWKVYARKRELMVNEYEKENICDTFLFLDARSITNIGTVLENTLEFNIKIALGVSNLLLMRRNVVGMAVYNDQIQVLPPKSGIKQQNEMLRFLTGVYSKGWCDFNLALFYTKPYMKTKTTLIIISNLEYDSSFLKSIEHLTALGYKIIIISPSSLEFELKASSYSGPQEKLELFRLGRENFITELRSLGASVLEYSPYESMDEIIERISGVILR